MTGFSWRRASRASLGPQVGGAGLARYAGALVPTREQPPMRRRAVVTLCILTALALVLAWYMGWPPFRRVDPRREGADLLLAGKHAEAEARFTEAVKADPKDPKAYLLRAMARIRIGDLDGAVADGNAAINLDRDLAGARVERASALLARVKRRLSKDKDADLALAASDCDRALALLPDGKSQVHHLLSMIHEERGDLD